ncbi:hypothetical protein BHE74_00000765 [Ensete ventricosum]|nr:hypothetical protein BHE74_00000765 [Ensete ventricosum]RZR88111.1 hypothetical protein BHM03_00015637 [Ensete ventricosum]
MGPQQQRRCIGDGLERKKTAALGRRQRLEAARWCDRAGDGCFKTGDVAGGFTGAVGRRQRLLHATGRRYCDEEDWQDAPNESMSIFEA